MKPFFLLALCFLSIGLAAQPKPAIRLEQVILPGNPPSGIITCFLEDSQGFLWYGDYTGLNRYDGYELLSFRYDPHNPASISDNKVSCILQDSLDNLWVGTQVGLNYLDIQTQQFRHYTDTARYGLGQEYVADLVFDKQGNLWVANFSGLYLFDPVKERFFKKFPESPQEKKIPNHLETADKGVYFTSGNELFQIEPGSPAKALITVPARIYSATLDTSSTARRTLRFGTLQGYFSLDLATLELQELPRFQGEFTSEFPQKNRFRLINTDNGLFRFDTKAGQVEGPISVEIIGEKPANPQFVTIYEGSSGITWFFDRQGLLYRRDPRKERFRHAPIKLDGRVKSVAYLFELYEFSPGVLVLPADPGASLFNLEKGEERPFPHTPTYNREAWDLGPVCFLEEPDGKLWIGAGKGLFLFDKNTGRFVEPEGPYKELAQLQGIIMRKIHRDRRGNLWLATWANGLYKVNFRDHTVKQYLISPDERASFLHAGRTILETRDGDLWIGTRGGLLRYLEDRDSFQVYRHIPGDPTSMSENTSFCLYEDADGNIWSGSYGGGLNFLDLQTGKFQHYTTKDGLSDNNVLSLLPDGKNNLWISTFKGLSVFNLDTRTFQNFTAYQGLLNPDFAAFAYGKSPYTQNLFFASGIGGVDYFHPDSVLIHRPAPRVWFTGFKLFNEPVADFTPHTTRLDLRYDQKVLTFDFAALDYSSPETVQYAYQLVGFDDTWQYVGSKRSVTFTNLDPGQYTLRVKASNADGIWDPAESNVHALEIYVAPPWWATWWFRTGLALAILGLISGIYSYRIRQIREREAIKTALNQRIAQVKMEALRSQMNPHFVFNCLSSLKLFVEKNETEKASDHISKFATLLRRVLDDARTETETVPLERELDTLRRYVELEMIRFKDKFAFQIDIHPDTDLRQTEIPPLILQPFVENAILHGLQHKTGDGLLQVRVVEKEDHLRIDIEDNGIGREAARAIKARNPLPQESHGLNVTAERLDYFSQKYGARAAVETTDLFDAEGLPAGTRVTLTFQKT